MCYSINVMSYQPNTSHFHACLLLCNKLSMLRSDMTLYLQRSDSDDDDDDDDSDED
jgi:hypothetical protein